MSKKMQTHAQQQRSSVAAVVAVEELLPITHHRSPVTSSKCFHCNEPIPTGTRIIAHIGDREELVCCHGCRAVAELIADAGLSDFYRFRERPSEKVDASDNDWTNYDQPQLLEELSRAEDDGTRSAIVLLDGLGCAACAWLIDRMLLRERGVRAVNVNVATGRVRVRWNADVLRFSKILSVLAELGFKPHPMSGQMTDTIVRDERRAALRRLIVAALGMMQVMMFAVALYSSDTGPDAMDAQIRQYLRYVSLLCATPVLFYAGLPFLLNAWRAIRARVVTMDVPVTLGLLLAYFASITNTVRQSGDVYFDSVTMFVFFLSVSRFVEMMVRHRSGDFTDALARLLPSIAHRFNPNQELQDVPLASLRVEDEVLIRSGETVPADGIIIDGASRFDESMLTGESLPTSRANGARIHAGTTNLHSPVRMRVSAIGNATALSGIVQLLQRAEHEKAPQLSAADRAASWFLRRILLAAAIVASAWLMIDPSRALSATLAVLVVTCPCALSLALPTALAAATTALARKGVLVARTSALDQLATLTHIVFDKTGTLTRGEFVIDHCESQSELSDSECRRIACALEQHSEHPIARAFRMPGQTMQARDIRIVAGLGIEGTVNGKRYRIGRRQWIEPASGDCSDDTLIYLGDESGALASFRLVDQVRDDARQAIADLRARKLSCEILSGDAWISVAHAATACGIERFAARQTPADKLAHVRELIVGGATVGMIGDGINDTPVFKGATVSIAMARASALAQVTADIVLLRDSLSTIADAVDIARRTQRIIKQNLTWAAAYNLLALPLAAFGFVPPWLAAIGMSVSSMVVVLNALRLTSSVRAEEREITRSTANSTLRSTDLTPSRAS